MAGPEIAEFIAQRAKSALTVDSKEFEADAEDIDTIWEVMTNMHFGNPTTLNIIILQKKK
ncbi:MAG: hypothetical protein LBD72_02480 [Puniceicoccales bacterium]|jgi:hypothetical protein|nr:hypothetical protein [Puniceicoccales bacterium]